jgi:hypothetical protein
LFLHESLDGGDEQKAFHAKLRVLLRFADAAEATNSTAAKHAVTIRLVANAGSVPAGGGASGARSAATE